MEAVDKRQDIVMQGCAESLRRLLSTLSVIDCAAPPVFTAKKSDVMAGEALLVAYLQETFGHGLRSLKFIRQIGT